MKKRELITIFVSIILLATLSKLGVFTWEYYSPIVSFSFFLATIAVSYCIVYLLEKNVRLQRNTRPFSTWKSFSKTGNKNRKKSKRKENSQRKKASKKRR